MSQYLMIQDKNYKILHETEQLVLGYVFEDAYLQMKATGTKIKLGDFYGEPTCGLISNLSDWCIVSGSAIIIWTQNEITKIDDNELCWAYDIRQTDKQKVKLLLDPWADDSSIWEFNIVTKEKHKIKDFPNYRDKEYSDKVKW